MDKTPWVFEGDNVLGFQHNVTSLKWTKVEITLRDSEGNFVYEEFTNDKSPMPTYNEDWQLNEGAHRITIERL